MKKNLLRRFVLVGGICAAMAGASGCMYGYGNYGRYSNANKVMTTAAADTLSDFPITNFQAADGSFEFNGVAWGSTMEELEAVIGQKFNDTNDFADGRKLADLNYSVKLAGYITVGLQPLFDENGGLASINVYFEDTYTNEQLDQIYTKVKEEAVAAFGEMDKEETGTNSSGNTEYTTTVSFWYHQVDDNTMTTLQIGKLDGGNGTTGVVVGVNCYNPEDIEEESESEIAETAAEK